MQNALWSTLFVLAAALLTPAGSAEAGAIPDAAPAASPVARPAIVRAAILSDRLEQTVAVMQSTLEAAAPTTCVAFLVVTSDAAALARLLDDAELDARVSIAPAEWDAAGIEGESLTGSGDAPCAHGLHAVTVASLESAEAALEARGITPVWQRPAFRAGAAGRPRRTPWSLRERPSDSDAKHAHPLNLLRFYLPELPLLRGASRVLLLDDDVCVRSDLRHLYDAAPMLDGSAADESGGSGGTAITVGIVGGSAEESESVSVSAGLAGVGLSAGAHTLLASPDASQPVLLASCQMQMYDRSGGVSIRTGAYTYADTPFLGSVGSGVASYKLCPAVDEDAAGDGEEEEEEDCEDDEDEGGGDGRLPARGPRARLHPSPPGSCAPAALEPKLTALHHDISGRHTFRNETAWNFGVALLHLGRWRANTISHRVDRWFLANEHFGFFAPTSVSFGLGLAYLALAGHVQCWAPEDHAVIDGLGYLTSADLAANGIGAEHIAVRCPPRPSLPPRHTSSRTPRMPLSPRMHALHPAFAHGHSSAAAPPPHI